MRVFLAFALMIALLIPAAAQEDMPWQAAISGQIEALRAGDGATALTFAGEGFRTQFEGKPDQFMAAIFATGYKPIAESRSQSFGNFNKVSDSVVLQVVKFIGSDQGLYEALYQMTTEDDGSWHVLGVALKKETGVAV